MPKLQPTSVTLATIASLRQPRTAPPVRLARSAQLGITVRVPTRKQLTHLELMCLIRALQALSASLRGPKPRMTAFLAPRITTVNITVRRTLCSAPRAGTVKSMEQAKSLRCLPASSAPWVTSAPKVRRLSAPTASTRTRLGRVRAKRAQLATSAPSSTLPTICRVRRRRCAVRTITAPSAPMQEFNAPMAPTLPR